MDYKSTIIWNVEGLKVKEGSGVETFLISYVENPYINFVTIISYI